MSETDGIRYGVGYAGCRVCKGVVMSLAFAGVAWANEEEEIDRKARVMAMVVVFISLMLQAVLKIGELL